MRGETTNETDILEGGFTYHYNLRMIICGK